MLDLAEISPMRRDDSKKFINITSNNRKAKTGERYFKSFEAQIIIPKIAENQSGKVRKIENKFIVPLFKNIALPKLDKKAVREHKQLLTI